MSIHSDNSKIAGIIIAAGTSSRMGQAKQLLPFKHTTMLDQVIQNCLESLLEPVIVVIGHDANKIQTKVDFSKTTLVINDDFKQGQSSSLKAGLKKIPFKCNAAMFVLADQPLVDKTIIDTIINEFNRSDSLIAIPYFEKKRGNPVIIHKTLFKRMEKLTGDSGARVLFDEHEQNTLKINIDDDAILFDIDNPEDYKNLKQMLGF